MFYSFIIYIYSFLAIWNLFDKKEEQLNHILYKSIFHTNAAEKVNIFKVEEFKTYYNIQINFLFDIEWLVPKIIILSLLFFLIYFFILSIVEHLELFFEKPTGIIEIIKVKIKQGRYNKIKLDFLKIVYTTLILLIANNLSVISTMALVVLTYETLLNKYNRRMMITPFSLIIFHNYFSILLKIVLLAILLKTYYEYGLGDNYNHNIAIEIFFKVFTAFGQILYIKEKIYINNENIEIYIKNGTDSFNKSFLLKEFILNNKKSIAFNDINCEENKIKIQAESKNIIDFFYLEGISLSQETLKKYVVENNLNEQKIVLFFPLRKIIKLIDNNKYFYDFVLLKIGTLINKILVGNFSFMFSIFFSSSLIFVGANYIFDEEKMTISDSTVYSYALMKSYNDFCYENKNKCKYIEIDEKKYYYPSFYTEYNSYFFTTEIMFSPFELEQTKHYKFKDDKDIIFTYLYKFLGLILWLIFFGKIKEKIEKNESKLLEEE